MEALGKDLFVVGKVPGLPVLLRLCLASPRLLLLPMPALVEALVGRVGRKAFPGFGTYVRVMELY